MCCCRQAALHHQRHRQATATHPSSALHDARTRCAPPAHRPPVHSLALYFFQRVPFLPCRSLSFLMLVCTQALARACSECRVSRASRGRRSRPAALPQRASDSTLPQAAPHSGGIPRRRQRWPHPPPRAQLTVAPSGMALCCLSTSIASVTLDCSAPSSSRSMSSSALSISSSMPVILPARSGCSADTRGKRRSPIIVFCCSGVAAASIAAFSG
mmetsp:Transcript_21127/g.46549  ORF Transcript_21127/g.46549 Transcript_21127/m.46549 type:complete len:214 (+) Transcript_21127:25-666(+)